MEQVSVVGRVVAEDESAQHSQAQPGLEISPQIRPAKQDLLGKPLSAHQSVTHRAERSGNGAADRVDFILPCVGVQHRSVSPCVVEATEQGGCYYQIGLFGEPDPQLEIAGEGPLSRDATHFLVEAATPEAGESRRVGMG